MHRSIRDNIAYGRPGASQAEIERAARLAHADAFIADLVDHKGRRGYDAQVGERGVKLSGGGGQAGSPSPSPRHVKDAPIMILDEATSALDSQVEAAIQDLLDTLMAGKTVLAIAHRLSTIAALDGSSSSTAAGSSRRGPTPSWLPRVGLCRIVVAPIRRLPG